MSREISEHHMLQGLDPNPLRSLSIPPVEEAEIDAAISDCQYVGSYNWKETATEPTIMVPGCPRVVIDKPVPFRLKYATAMMHADYNGLMSPTAPMLPTVLAVDTVTADFEWSQVDFLTNRNGLRKILSWIEGKKSKNDQFRLDFELLGDRTVTFSRYEARSMVSADGYGYNFKDAVALCEPGFEHSPRNNRVSNYKFGGLNLVVRYEVDACTKSQPPLAPPVPPDTAVTVTDGLTLVHLGRNVPQSHIVELTSISKNSRNLSKKHMQMHLSQTPRLVVGEHEEGLFTKIEHKQANLPTSQQGKLNTLRRVLRMIHAMCVEVGSEERLSLVWKDGEMKVYKRVAGAEFLPETYLSKFQRSA